VRSPGAPSRAQTKLAARSRSAQRQSWETLAAGLPDFRDAHSTRYYRACEIALIERAFGDLSGKRLLKLDLWNEAFNTRISGWAQERGAQVFGLDASREVVVRAQRNARAEGHDLTLLRADIRELPFADGSFDLLYTMGTIEHVAEYEQAVREIARVLVPGGRAIVGVPYKWDVGLRPLLVAALEAVGKYPYSPEKCFGAGELRGVIERAGLRFVRRTGILTFPGLLRMADLWLYTREVPLHHVTRWLVRPFEWLECEHAWAGRLGYLIAAVVDKP
jgi:SAM-dependent methyltransferase